MSHHYFEIFYFTRIVYPVTGVGVKDYIPKSLVYDEERSDVMLFNERVVRSCEQVASKLVKVSKRIVSSQSVGRKLLERVSRRRLAIHNSSVDDSVTVSFDAIDVYFVLLSLDVVSCFCGQEKKQFFQKVSNQKLEPSSG